MKLVGALLKGMAILGSVAYGLAVLVLAFLNFGILGLLIPPLVVFVPFMTLSAYGIAHFLGSAAFYWGTPFLLAAFGALGDALIGKNTTDLGN